MFIYTSPAFAIRTGSYHLLMFSGTIPEDPQYYADKGPDELFSLSHSFLGCTGSRSTTNPTMLELVKDLGVESPSTKEPYFHEGYGKCILPVDKIELDIGDAKFGSIHDKLRFTRAMERALWPKVSGAISGAEQTSFTKIPTKTSIEFSLVEESLVESFNFQQYSSSYIGTTFDVEYFDGSDWVFIFENKPRAEQGNMVFPTPITARKFRISWVASGQSHPLLRMWNIQFLAAEVPETFVKQDPITHAILFQDTPSTNTDVLFNYGIEVPIYLLHAGGPYDGKPVSLSTDTPDPEVEIGLLNCRFGNSLMETL